MKIKGQFNCKWIDGRSAVFPNEITAGGLQRVLELMGRQSTEGWDAIRLVGSNPSQYIQKAANTQVQPGRLISTAIFAASELPFAAVTAEMYAGSVKVATAPVSIPAGQTVYIEREDLLSAN